MTPALEAHGKALDDLKVHVKVKLSGLWTSLIFLYVYGDYFGLYKTGQLEAMLDGRIPPLGPVTQTVLVGTSVMMAVPSLMVFLSMAFPANASRWLNIIFGAVYAAIILLTMPGAWLFYQFLGVIEVILSLLIVWYAWTWPRRPRSSARAPAGHASGVVGEEECRSAGKDARK